MSLLGRFISSNKGLKYKLLLAFSLMSVIPLLACVYVISNYLFPELKDIAGISMIILASALISLLGLAFGRSLIDPVINMALEARMIAGGDYDRKISASEDDEVGYIGQSINAMTQRIKSNLDEIKNYGQKMRDINIDVHKKVLALSSLLQIGDLISSGSIKLDALLEMAVEKASSVFEGGFGALYMAKEDDGELSMRASYNLDNERLKGLTAKKGAHSPMERVVENHPVTILDKGAKLSRDQEGFLSSYNMKNALLVPIRSGRKDLATLVIGTPLDDFRYKAEDVDMVKIFAKQITIAIESEMLSRRAEELSIMDELTGLYNKNFIVQRLEEEIKRAIFYQRPCSFLVFNVDGFRKFRDSKGELAAEELIKKLAKLIKDNSTPVGKVARVGGDEFAMLLPEKNKKEAARIAEEVRKKVEAASLLKEEKVSITVSAGVSENPIDGTSGDELMKRAMEALAHAKSSGKNRVEA